MISILDLHPEKIMPEPNTGCWLWTATMNSNGYGRVRHLGRNWYAHRVAFLLAEGYLPPRPLVMDHLCRNPSCCNPDHLQVVTIAENVRRGRAGEVNGARNREKTHCPHGHEYDEANTYVNPAGSRECRACNREKCRRRRHERKAA